jgi:hypothetical protein
MTHPQQSDLRQSINQDATPHFLWLAVMLQPPPTAAAQGVFYPDRGDRGDQKPRTTFCAFQAPFSSLGSVIPYTVLSIVFSAGPSADPAAVTFALPTTFTSTVV